MQNKATDRLSQLLTIIREVAHQVRSPLSVISNDLSYFKDMLPEGEVSRSLDKCQEISAIFKPAQELILPEDINFQEDFDIKSTLLEVLLSRLEPSAENISVRGVRSNFQKIIRWLDEDCLIISASIDASGLTIQTKQPITHNKLRDLLRTEVLASLELCLESQELGRVLIKKFQDS